MLGHPGLNGEEQPGPGLGLPESEWGAVTRLQLQAVPGGADSFRNILCFCGMKHFKIIMQASLQASAHPHPGPNLLCKRPMEPRYPY